MKQSIRFFAIGLLAASVIFFGFYYFLPGAKTSIEDVPLEDMVSEIESQGYRVITENEFISFTLNKEDKPETEEKDESNKKDDSKKKDSSKKKSDDSTDKKKKDKDKKKKKKDKDDDKVIKAKFTTEDGVVTQDIADILKDEKIIDDRQKFLDFLDDNDYSPYIQIGTFEVNSDMTMKEIAEIITTYPGN